MSLKAIVLRADKEVAPLTQPDPTTPLTEASYYIMISLLTPLHGYGVMQKAQALSGGRVRLGPGTLYGALANLHASGLIEPAGEDERESRRKTYVITRRGRQVIEAEIERLEAMITHGRAMLSKGGADRDEQA